MHGIGDEARLCVCWLLRRTLVAGLIGVMPGGASMRASCAHIASCYAIVRGSSFQNQPMFHSTETRQRRSKAAADGLGGSYLWRLVCDFDEVAVGVAQVD